MSFQIFHHESDLDNDYVLITMPQSSNSSLPTSPIVGVISLNLTDYLCCVVNPRTLEFLLAISSHELPNMQALAVLTFPNDSQRLPVILPLEDVQREIIRHSNNLSAYKAALMLLEPSPNVKSLQIDKPAVASTSVAGGTIKVKDYHVSLRDGTHKFSLTKETYEQVLVKARQMLMNPNKLSTRVGVKIGPNLSLYHFEDKIFGILMRQIQVKIALPL